MPTKVLKWGLLSTAQINQALIPPIKNSERNQLLGVASRELDKAKAYAKKWDIPQSFGSYDAMLADPEIDVVYISLPNSMHAEWTIKAAQSGKHVLCEKPLAMTVNEVDRVREAADRWGVIVAEAFMYRHHPQTQQVKLLVDEGQIGNLQLIRGSFTFQIVDRGDIRLFASLGGGSIWDVGCYPISYARFLAGGEPELVYGWQVCNQDQIDLQFVGQMLFPNGVMAQFDSGFQTPERTHIEVVGEGGSLDISNPYNPGWSNSIRLTHDSQVKEISVPGEELYSGEVEDLADAILYGRKPRISLEDSRGNVATIQALLESASLGRPVRLS
jgi:D-xylose 1-dehydrogenase (NADP+, D-xylono-1,5-lactone-forming)